MKGDEDENLWDNEEWQQQKRYTHTHTHKHTHTCKQTSKQASKHTYTHTRSQLFFHSNLWSRLLKIDVCKSRKHVHDHCHFDQVCDFTNRTDTDRQIDDCCSRPGPPRDHGQISERSHKQGWHNNGAQVYIRSPANLCVLFIAEELTNMAEPRGAQIQRKKYFLCTDMGNHLKSPKGNNYLRTLHVHI